MRAKKSRAGVPGHDPAPWSYSACYVPGRPPEQGSQAHYAPGLAHRRRRQIMAGWPEPAGKVRPMFEPSAEAMPAEELASRQAQRLRALVGRLLTAGGIQAERLRAAGVTAPDGITLADLPRLPMVAKADLWAAYPFGMIEVPAEDLVAVHGSSGTGGRPTLVGYTRADLKLWARMCARALAAAGATRASIVHNAYGYGLFTGGVGIHQGAVELGATVVPVSGGMTARQVTLIRDLRPDILTCTPSCAIRLGEALAAAGAGPGEGLTLKAGLFGAEPWTEALRT